MKILKKILYGLLILIGLILVFALVVPGKMKVNESIIINASRQEVYSFVSSLEKLSQQTVWQDIDPNVKKTFRGTDGEVGSVYRWESDHNQVGVGEQELIELTANEKVVHELRFYEPWESVDKAIMYTKSTENGTELQWEYESQKIPYPFNAMVTPFFTPKLKKDFQKSLTNIKQAIEE